jgi:hypothetical protein
MNGGETGLAGLQQEYFNRAVEQFAEKSGDKERMRQIIHQGLKPLRENLLLSHDKLISS